MKWHRSILHATAEALEAIFDKGYMADKVVERTLKANPKFGSRDRGQVASLVYDIVRYKRRIEAALGKTRPSKLEIIGAWLVLQHYPLPEGAPFNGLPVENILKRDKQHVNKRAIRESIPDWLDEMGQSELPERWDQEIAALNEQAELVLRVNTLKTDKVRLQEELERDGIHAVPLAHYPDALQVVQRKNVFRTRAFREGWFEVQDASSQCVAPFLQVEPGMRVIDVCAGAGGKSLHLAALMQNKGRIISLDVEEKKLRNLRQRVKRAGISIVESRLIDDNKVIKRLKRQADRVLLDVPCSGLGVLKRNPDAKWKLSPEQITEIKTLQADILARYSDMTKPGGLLVYATCSLMPSENIRQVEKFLQGHPDFTLEASQNLWPSEGFDGFFMARMRRDTAAETST